MRDLIERQDAIRLAEQGQIQGFEWQFKKLCELPSAEPEKVLVAEVKLSKEQIQDAVDNAVVKIKAELGPCDFCKHKDDCGYMSAYCPAERRTDETD